MKLSRTFCKYILLLSIFAFVVLFSSAGLFGSGMAMGSDGQMSPNCPFMPGMTSLCQMNPLEHIAMWQSMFTAIPSQNDILTILMLLLALAIAGTLLIRANRSTAPPKVPVSLSAFAYYKRHIPIVNSLQEAFSNGILHPKLY